MSADISLQTLELEANNTMDAAEAPRLQIIPIAERAFDAPEPIDFLIDGLTTRKSVNVIVGDAGSGKTYIVLDMGVCVSIGKDWLGHKTKRAAVLILDEESGERRLTRRLHELLSGHLVRREDNPQIFATCLEGFDARNLDDVNALQVVITQTGAELVIIDALMEVTPGADENSVKDILPALHNLRRVAEATGAAFWIIHHSSKNGGYRGTSAIKGKVDNMLMVEKPKGSKFIKFSAEKNRDVEERQFTAQANWIMEPPQFYLSETDIDSKAHTNKSQRQVLRYLLEHPNSTLEDITEGGLYSINTIRSAVQSLGEKYIKNTTADDSGKGKGGRGKKAVLTLTLDGEELAKTEAE